MRTSFVWVLLGRLLQGSFKDSLGFFYLGSFRDFKKCFVGFEGFLRDSLRLFGIFGIFLGFVGFLWILEGFFWDYLRLLGIEKKCFQVLVDPFGIFRDLFWSFEGFVDS